MKIHANAHFILKAVLRLDVQYSKITKVFNVLNTIGSDRLHEVFITMDYCEMSTKGIYSTIATKEAQKSAPSLHVFLKLTCLVVPSPKKIYVAFK